MPIKPDEIAQAIHENFTSPNESDSNWEAANVVDGLYAIARALHHVARALEGYVPEYSPEQQRRYEFRFNRYEPKDESTP